MWWDLFTLIYIFLSLFLSFSVSIFGYLNSSIHHTYISSFTIIQYISANDCCVTLAHAKIELTVAKCMWMMIWAPHLWAVVAPSVEGCMKSIGPSFLQLSESSYCDHYWNLTIFKIFSPLERWCHRGRSDQWRYAWSSSCRACNCSCLPIQRRWALSSFILQSLTSFWRREPRPQTLCLSLPPVLTLLTPPAPLGAPTRRLSGQRTPSSPYRLFSEESPTSEGPCPQMISP